MPPGNAPATITASEPTSKALSFREMLAVVLRHAWWIAATTALGLALSGVYLLLTPPRYAASTAILIDPGQSHALPETLAPQPPFREKLMVDSQMEVIRSKNLLKKAASQAGLAPANADPQTWQRRLEAFAHGLSVERVRGSYVLRISYTATDPDTARKRANLIARTYLQDTLDAQYQASRRTHRWLKTRLSSLREELANAEQAVEDYKQQTDILIPNGQAGGMQTRQRAELQERLQASRAKEAETQARYDHIQRVLQSQNPDMATSELRNQPAIAGLRSRYLELASRAQEIKRQQGQGHQAYTTIRQRMESLRELMLEEYERIATGYQNAHRLARADTRRLEQTLKQARTDALASQEQAIALRALQRNADATRQIYTEMLEKYHAETERQAAPITHARIISEASRPTAPNWPKPLVVVLGGLALGLGAGMALAFAHEQWRPRLWHAEGLEHATGLPCLGLLPEHTIPPDALRIQAKPGQHPGFHHSGFQAITEGLAQANSTAAEVMRSIQLGITGPETSKEAPPQAGQAIAFISAQAGEGKSVTSCYFARHLSQSGQSVALVDGDFRRPTLTRWLTPEARQGVCEVAPRLASETRENVARELMGLCYRAARERLFFLPAAGCETSITNGNLVSAPVMRAFVYYLKQMFDVVVLDVPPLMHMVDARALAGAIDHFIFLAAWGQTDSHWVRQALARSPEVHEKTRGALLTRVDMTKEARYGYGSYPCYGYPREAQHGRD